MAEATTHGGTFQPPSGGRGGSPFGRGATTAPAPATPRPGSVAPVKAPSAPPIPTTGRGTLADYTEWSYWWRFNKDPFLDLKRRLFDDGPLTGPDADGIGSSRRPTVRQVRELVVPALLRALDEDASNDLTSAAIIALARLGEEEGGVGVDAIRERLLALVRHKSQEISETAILALGILGAPVCAFELSELILDTKAGRKLCGRTSRVPDRSRAFAAFGMGLLGGSCDSEDLRRFLVHRLVRTLNEVDTAPPDLAVACVIALGRIPLDDCPLPTAGASRKDDPVVLSRGEQVLHLLEILEDRGADRHVRAHVPSSLVYLLRDPGLAASVGLRTRVVDAMTELMEARRAPREVLQGCAQALGHLVDASPHSSHVRAREVLLGAGKKLADVGARHFVLLSLGRIAAVAADHPVETEVLQEIRRVLLRNAARPGSSTARWSLLSLALLERERSRRGKVPSPAVAQAIRDTLQRVSSPSDVGCLAIASGLLRDPSLESALLAKFDRVGEDAAKGRLAIGLALLGSRDVRPRLEEVLSSSVHRPELLSDAAIALGLLGDRTVVPALVARLGEARSLSARAAYAQALGHMGDASAVEPLIAMLEDERAPDLARAFAAVALGRLVDLDPLPWNVRLSVDAQYLAPTTTLHDEAGFGVLNVL